MTAAGRSPSPMGDPLPDDLPPDVVEEMAVWHQSQLCFTSLNAPPNTPLMRWALQTARIGCHIIRSRGVSGWVEWCLFDGLCGCTHSHAENPATVKAVQAKAAELSLRLREVHS